VSARGDAVDAAACASPLAIVTAIL